MAIAEAIEVSGPTVAAFIPSRRDAQVNDVALAKVREDKEREANDGFDGTWVAHPDLVPVAMEVFGRHLGQRMHQLDRQREDVQVTANQLLDMRVPGGTVTEAGLRNNVSVGIQYIESWLRGTGAAAIYNLMEDAATAEISRSQVWQWVRHGVPLVEGPRVTRGLVEQFIAEELGRLRGEIGSQAWGQRRFEEARQLFEQVALCKDYVEFLTLPGYELID